MAFLTSACGGSNHFDSNEMWWLISISVLCAVLSGVARGVSNVISFHYEISIFNKHPEFNPKISWMNKWKNGDPKQGEKFWGSSRWFVMFTDKWHLYEFLHRLFFIGAFVPCGVLIAKSAWFAFGILVLYIIFATAFHLSYELFY